MYRFAILVPTFMVMGVACGPIDSEDALVFSGLEAGSREAHAVLALVNDDDIGLIELDVDVGLDRRAARNITEHRNGPDGQVGTNDDDSFDTVEELDSIPFVGEAALKALLEYARSHGYYADTIPGGDEPIPSRPGIRFSERIFREVMSLYSITDAENLLVRAIALGDGNGYLNRSELVAGAESLRQDHETVRGYTYSESVLEAVIREYAIEDRMAYLVEATEYDVDNNGYLNGTELLAAAQGIVGAADEIGIVSDIDRTVLPPYDGNVLPPPYAGVADLYRALETHGHGEPGDTHYVTARSPERVVGIPEWLADHDLPAGPIDTGVGTEPWIAEPEKVRDISEVLDRRPDQSFVLFGDSGHRDPEVYRTIIGLYPNRVLAVFIHRVNNVSAERVRGLHVIRDYGEAAAILYDMDLISEAAARRVMLSVQSEHTDTDL